MTATDREPKVKPPSLTPVKRAARSVATAEHRLNQRKDARDAAILAAYAEGGNTRLIAAAAGLSNSGVRKIVGIDTS